MLEKSRLSDNKSIMDLLEEISMLSVVYQPMDKPKPTFDICVLDMGEV